MRFARLCGSTCGMGGYLRHEVDITTVSAQIGLRNFLMKDGKSCSTWWSPPHLKPMRACTEHNGKVLLPISHFNPPGGSRGARNRRASRTGKTDTRETETTQHGDAATVTHRTARAHTRTHKQPGARECGNGASSILSQRPALPLIF